jgi:hypothetical protein
MSISTSNRKLKDIFSPESIHTTYLEATLKLKPVSFNNNAQKTYDDLTEEQKYIDIFFSNDILPNKSD